MKDNKDKIVTTVDGTEAKRSDCRYIKKQYHKIGDVKVINSGQCYFINDKYYRADTGYITYDYSINEYVIKNNTTLVTGIIGFEKDGSPIFGDFTINCYENIKIVDSTGSSHIGLNKSIFQKGLKWYRLCLLNGKYYHINSMIASKIIRKAEVQNNYKRSLPYNASEEVMDSYNDMYNNYTPVISEKVNNVSKHLKDLTFGVEFETTKGIIPEPDLKKTGLIPLRDGSIKGIEYVTVPMQGSKGVTTLMNACESLTTYTEEDNTCSLHLHIGNVPRTESFIIALFRVLSCVQDNMFELFPLYKRNNLGVKRQNYTKELPFSKLFVQMDKTITPDNVTDNFNVLYKYLSGGYSLSDNGFKSLSDVTHHPSDPRGTSKWYIQSRYSWINIIPLVFGNKKTVEFRIHTGTTDTTKTLNYLYICSAIINYVKNNESKILNNFNYTITLQDIINYIYMGDFRRELISYIEDRRSFQYHKLKTGDISPDESSFNYRSYYFEWYRHNNKLCNINFKKVDMDNHLDGVFNRLRRNGNNIFRVAVDAARAENLNIE